MLPGNRLFQKLACLLDFAHCLVIFRPQATVAFGEYIADNPQAVLYVIEGNEPVVEHEHGIVKADFVPQTLGKALDETNHVIAEVTNGPGDQRREAWKPDGAKTLDALAQERDRIAL